MIEALVSHGQNLVIRTGYLGVAFVAFLENFFPPLPSEVIFPFVGFVASRGELEIMLVIVAGVFGTFVGALFWYLAGYFLGATKLKTLVTRYGKPLGIKIADIEGAERWFEKYEAPVILFGRLIPLVRTFISIPAGFVRMRLPLFSFLTVIGSGVWVGILSFAGFLLGDRWESAVPYFERYQLALEVLILIAIALLVFKQLRLKG